MLMKMLHKSNKTYVGGKQHHKNNDEENKYEGKNKGKNARKLH
jgi:hypothetical protein